MANRFIKLGDKVDLYKSENKLKENEQLKVYKSQIIDIMNDDVAKISMPFEGTKLIPLAIGEKFIVCIYTNKGLFNCIGQIKDRYRQENLFVLEIKFLSKLEKYQRREYFRLDCIIEIQYLLINDEDLKIITKVENDIFDSNEDKLQLIEAYQEINKNWSKGTITDISGGGAKIIMNSYHEKNSKMMIKIPLRSGEDEKTYQLKAHVISSIKLRDKVGFYETRINFFDIKKEDREAIVRFVFEEERRIRRKEKGLD